MLASTALVAAIASHFALRESHRTILVPCFISFSRAVAADGADVGDDLRCFRLSSLGRMTATIPRAEKTASQFHAG